MFAGAYWGSRPETQQDAARRLLAFIERGSEISEALGSWYPKQRRKPTRPLKPIATELGELASRLKSNRRDTDGTVIEELGFSIGVWNGESMSLSATIGASSPFVPNSILLSDSSGAAGLSDEDWRLIIEDEWGGWRGCRGHTGSGRPPSRPSEGCVSRGWKV